MCIFSVCIFKYLVYVFRCAYSACACVDTSNPEICHALPA